jgi:putative membrane protein insertion efficiency factor
MTRIRRAPIEAALLGIIALYRRIISPLLPRACRFYPSCSEYARDAITMHGARRGVALAAMRLARCHPWCEGGIDPVPSRNANAPCAHHAPAAMKGRA